MKMAYSGAAIPSDAPGTNRGFLAAAKAAKARGIPFVVGLTAHNGPITTTEWFGRYDNGRTGNTPEGEVPVGCVRLDQ